MFIRFKVRIDVVGFFFLFSFFPHAIIVRSFLWFLPTGLLLGFFSFFVDGVVVLRFAALESWLT